MLQRTMIIEGSKIINEEISVNPAKRNFILHNINELTQQDGRKKKTAKSVCDTNLTELLLTSFAVSDSLA